MIDVSFQSRSSGLLNLCVESIRGALNEIPKSEDGSLSAKVGIITFDRVVHFYNLSVSYKNKKYKKHKKIQKYKNTKIQKYKNTKILKKNTKNTKTNKQTNKQKKNK